MKYAKWTNKQMVRLREYYPVMSKEELVREFAPHPWCSIKGTAFRSGIRRKTTFRNWKAICKAHVMQSGLFEATS